MSWSNTLSLRSSAALTVGAGEKRFRSEAARIQVQSPHDMHPVAMEDGKLLERRPAALQFAVNGRAAKGLRWRQQSSWPSNTAQLR